MEAYKSRFVNCQIPRFHALDRASQVQRHTNNRLRRGNVRFRGYFVMSLSNFALRRTSTTPYNYRFKYRYLSSFCVSCFTFNAMADESAGKKISVEVAEVKVIDKNKTKEEPGKSQENSATSVPHPPPPEKPLPGDCCGSGCVRCVWDVYYEELDEYEKLCKTDQKSN